MTQLKLNCPPISKKSQFSKNYLLLVVLLVFALTSNATTYYFSSSLGNDSYTSTQAKSQATPWKSINKLNSIFSTLVAGDSILLKRGDVFYGAIVVTKSGSSTNPIVINAYGSGNKPVISGFATLSSWVAVGNGVYQATTAGISNDVNMVTLDNQPQHIGRTPNIDAVNGGYLNFETSTSTSITDNQLTALPNWTGAEIVVRKLKHVIEHWPITSHSGQTIAYQSNSAAYPITYNGYGYFIQKDIRCLDQVGEWFYNTSTKYLQMYFGSNNPASSTIKVSTIDMLLNTAGYSNITINNIAFEGANINAINIGSLSTTVSKVTVTNCDINYSGLNGVYATNANYPTVENCTVNNSYNNAIDVENEGGIGAFARIRNNSIKNVGTRAGMGASFDNSSQGITVYGTDALIEYNNIDSAGYIGIAFYYNNAKVRYNYITNFSFVKDDGGGIYTWTGPVGGPIYSGREVKNNILINGIGAGYGTPNGLRTASGIYMDDGTVGVDISGNSIANASQAGLYLHNTHEVSVTNNTAYNCDNQQMLFVHDNITPTDPLRNIVFNNNILVAKTANQYSFAIRSIKDDLNQTGPTNSNYYARPVSDDVVISGLSSVLKSAYSLEGWQSSFIGKDVNSKKSPKTIVPYTIGSLSANLLTNGDFASTLTGISFWSSNSNQSTSWDGTSKLTGTGSLRISFPVSTTNTYTLCTKSVGALSNGKNYIVRFNTLGDTSLGTFRVYLKNTATNTNVVPIQIGSFNSARKNQEFLFTAPNTTSTGGLVIEIQQNSGTTYIDDIQLFEAQTTTVNIDGEMRFEFNASTTAKTISLDAKYIGIDGTIYDGTITLQPYTSKVLIKNGAATVVTALSVQTLKATAAVPVISCFGSNTTVAITASGGTAPYTGTGSFAVNAGTGSLKISVASPVAGSSTLVYSTIGAISNLKSYVFRFSTLTTSINGTSFFDSSNLTATLRQTSSPWSNITATQTASLSAGRTDHQFVFTAPLATTDASFVIEIFQSERIIYIDNIAFFESTAAGEPISNNLYPKGQMESSISNLYTWSPTNNHLAQYDFTSKITNTYNYLVQDATGAKNIVSAATAQPTIALRAASSSGTITVVGGTTTVVVTATGGTAPYTGTGNFTNINPGTYNYTITDANGCSSITNITIAPPLNATANVPAINCFGGNTTIAVTASGGTAPYTGTGSFAVNAGTGSLKISAAVPVAGSSTMVYSTIGAVSNLKSYVFRFSTLGTTINGSLTAAIRQTTSPWSNITVAQSASFGTGRINHQFIFTAPTTTADASFVISILQSSGTVYIDNIAFFESTASGVPISNNLYPKGQMESSISNLYTWSSTNNHLAQYDFTSKIGNTYNYLVQDSAGSKVIVSAATAQPAAALSAASSAGNITVLGGTTTVVVTATGGTGLYTGTGSFTNVKAGTYSYTVTDANGCTSVTTITLTQPAARTASRTTNSLITGKVLLNDTFAVLNDSLNIISYPNPTYSEFALSVNGGTTEKVDISVRSIEGRIVFKTQGPSNKKYTFGNEFASGIYIIQVFQGKIMQTLKVVKTK